MRPLDLSIVDDIKFRVFLLWEEAVKVRKHHMLVYELLLLLTTKGIAIGKAEREETPCQKTCRNRKPERRQKDGHLCKHGDEHDYSIQGSRRMRVVYKEKISTI